ncbi:MAG: BMP family ABC transporter substrate-binding protein, partial [Candidatus Caldatribacteriota bacterium]|nr:BMP family ABC transporter substrate-binding protein [Candidatus Caldatribacteriota bacterium]
MKKKHLLFSIIFFVFLFFSIPSFALIPGDFGSAGGGPPDGVVDFEDLMIFAMAYGSTPAEANWNPLCDIYPDEVIDFEDLMIFAMNYGRKIKIGLVFDIGGRGDESFNDSAYRGIEWAEIDFDIEHAELEPEQDEDREIYLRNLAEIGCDLVIGVGFLFTDAITIVADEFPDTNFAIIDGYIPDKSNVVSLLFKEHEGSFLVGMIAGMRAIEDGKNIVGFIGGMDIPLIHKFEAGYRAGVQYVFPECTIFSDYAGDTPEAFADPAKGKELALAQYNNYGEVGPGAWVIYHAAGLTGEGVFEAGKEEKRYVIGVDCNQNYMGYIEETGESFGLTSMVKHVDVAVYLTI